MAKLRKFTLGHNEKKDRWDLTSDTTDRVLKSFSTKESATTGGVLRKTLAAEGGSVKIQKVDGRYQEERTYPHSKDPKDSKG